LKEIDMTATLASRNVSTRVPARKIGRAVAIAFGALALACGGAQAQGHGFHGGYHGGGYYRGGGWGPGPFWGGIGLGLGIGLVGSALYYDQPDYVVVNQPPVYYPPPPAPVVVYPSNAPAAVVAAPAAADPIFYPRNGQTARQTEADRQACNRWATSQPSAMSDGSIFQRATLACMDGRGYTSR